MSMADNVARVTQARKLAIAQQIIGISLLCCGIGERATETLITHPTYFGIAAGIWVSRTGVLSNVMFCIRGLLYV